MPQTEMMTSELPYIDTPQDADRSGANTPGFTQDIDKYDRQRRPKPLEDFEEVDIFGEDTQLPVTLHQVQPLVKTDRNKTDKKAKPVQAPPRQPSAKNQVKRQTTQPKLTQAS